MPVTAFIGLGSNLDEPLAQVRRGLEALSDLPDTRCLGHSGAYRTEPVGVVDQPPFINAVACVTTSLDARALLAGLHGIEHHAGRIRDRHWGPRTLDLDLLVYGDEVHAESDLQVPHPELHRRAFVLYPLAEVAPDLVIPGLGPVQELCRRVPADGIERLADVRLASKR